MSVNRRDFLRSVASISGATLASTVSFAQTEQIQQLDASLPSPDLSGIEHVVVVMMENRSFDHLSGWMPNANGRQAGLEYPDNNGMVHATYRLTDYVGCAHPDPDHSYAGGRSEYDGGKMDGWLRTSTNDTFTIGYYTEPGSSAVLHTGAQLHHALQLFPFHPVVDISQSSLSARRADGQAEQYARPIYAADHLGSVASGRCEL